MFRKRTVGEKGMIPGVHEHEGSKNAAGPELQALDLEIEELETRTAFSYSPDKYQEGPGSGGYGTFDCCGHACD